MRSRKNRIPRVALLGEFSAGKSTLANLLLGRSQSPVRVTATQMPPLWYCFGDGPPLRITDDGAKEDLPEDDSRAVPVAGTKAVQVPLDAPILQRFDLFDMPGSSDPNMAPDVWDRLLPEMDIAIWCTPATQAWRQSEAALWDGLPPALQKRSMLLLTRIDKVSIADRPRVLKRVRSEAESQFRHVIPVALLTASNSDEASDASGMTRVLSALDDLLDNAEPAAPETPHPTRPDASGTVTALRPLSVKPRRVTALTAGRGTRRGSANSNALI